MSHVATNWAFQVKGLSPTAKVLLLHLADRHNPDFGCFPSQDRIAADCEISRSTVNRHLDDLERIGLIRRIPRVDPETKKQKSTQYLLAFEYSRVSKSDTVSRVSNNAIAVSHPRHTNIVNEPVKSNDRFDEFWLVYPRKVGVGAARKSYSISLKKASAQIIIDGAKRFAASVRGTDHKFIPHGSTWLNAERWADQLSSNTSQNIFGLNQADLALQKQIIENKQKNITPKINKWREQDDDDSFHDQWIKEAIK